MIVCIHTKADYQRLAEKCFRLHKHHYVYKFWSPWLKRYFYIGKGGERRAWNVVTRNGKFRDHMDLLAKKKLSPTVKISHWCKTAEEARYKESQLILYLLSKGHPLANGRRISCSRARQDGKWRRLRTAHLKPTRP